MGIQGIENSMGSNGSMGTEGIDAMVQWAQGLKGCIGRNSEPFLITMMWAYWAKILCHTFSIVDTSAKSDILPRPSAGWVSTACTKELQQALFAWHTSSYGAHPPGQGKPHATSHIMAERARKSCCILLPCKNKSLL